MKLDVDDGSLSIFVKRQNKIFDWYADSHGAVRAGTSTEGGLYQIWAKVEPTRDFELVAQHDKYDWDGLRFAGFHRNPETIYVSKLHEGRLALFEFDIGTRAIGALVESNPEVD